MHPSRNFHKATRNANSSWLVFPRLLLDPISCRLVSSAVRCRLPTALLPRPSLTAFCGFLLPTPDSRSLTHFRLRRRSRAQAFVWFRAKTGKGIVCLADHPHSVTTRTCHLVDFAITADHRGKIKVIEKTLESYLRAEKAGKHKDDGDSNCSSSFCKGTQRHGKKTTVKMKTIQTRALLKIG